MAKATNLAANAEQECPCEKLRTLLSAFPALKRWVTFASFTRILQHGHRCVKIILPEFPLLTKVCCMPFRNRIGNRITQTLSDTNKKENVWKSKMLLFFRDKKRVRTDLFVHHHVYPIPSSREDVMLQRCGSVVCVHHMTGLKQRRMVFF